MANRCNSGANMLKILIVRHGNTFDKGDVLRRVGLRTDMELSESGRIQCSKLGSQLIKLYPKIDQAFCSELKRTQQTAELILSSYPCIKCPITPLSILNEVDYGEDDGKPESEVKARLGEKALQNWDEYTILPDGWLFDINLTIDGLKTLVDDLANRFQNKTLLLVTSNGIARFFPKILQNTQCVKRAQPLKMPTASVSELFYETDKGWQLRYWAKSLTT